MLFTIINSSPAIKAIATYSRPNPFWKSFLQFCNTYGDYHSLPPSRRRQFLIDKEQQEKCKTADSESCL